MQLCPVFIFHMEKDREFLHHKKIAYDLRGCHDLDQRSFGQVQRHWKDSAKFWSGLFLSYGKSSYFTKRMLIGIRCVMILTQGQLVKLKVIRKKEFIICFRSLPFLWRHIGRSSFIIRLLMTCDCVMNLNQIRVYKVKSLWRKCIVPVKFCF